MPKVQTIEATAKRWKAYGCLGSMLLIGGIGTTFYGMKNDASGLSAIGAVAIVLGIILAVMAKAGKWWYHE